MWKPQIALMVLCVAAGALHAQDTSATRTVGKFHVTFLKKLESAVPKPKCTYLKPMSQSVRDKLKRAGVRVYGDGCLGCSVSPVRSCERPDLVDRERRRSDGFKVTRRNGTSFKMSNDRAKWVLQRYCRQSGTKLTWAPPEVDQAKERHEVRWFQGRCQ